MILLVKAWSASARASSLEARRRKRAAKLASLEKVSKVNYDECKPTPQDGAGNFAANKKMILESQEAWDKLTPAEWDAVKNYTASGHYSMNANLVNHAREPNVGWLDKLKKFEVSFLDNATTSNSFQSDLVLFRGVGTAEEEALGLDKAVEGDMLLDSKFVSTTHYLQVAKNFTGGGKVILEIRAPKGTKGLPVDHFDRTMVNNEREVILPRDRIYRVKKIYKKTFPLFDSDTSEYKVIQLDLINYDMGPRPIS